jgi:hypothetical protein
MLVLNASESKRILHIQQVKDNPSLPEFYSILEFGTDASAWHQLALC